MLMPSRAGHLVAGAAFGLMCLTGCDNKPAAIPAKTDVASTKTESPAATATAPAPAKPTVQATAKPEDVKAARAVIAGLGARSSCAPKEGDLLTDIVIGDGSGLKPEDIALFGKLTDLKKLQILNCRILNDEMAGGLSGLKNLTSLSLTNTVLNDETVSMIAKSFPHLVELDLSSNTNMSSGVPKILAGIPKLQRLMLVQNKINDISALQFEKLQDLRLLDLRGNMEAGDMTLEVVGALPKLVAFKHRSTAVNDSGVESLSKSTSLRSLLMQDFAITDQSGPHLAKLSNLAELEVFRCQGFGTEGLLALKGLPLTRLTLRDLPNVYDQGFDVFDDLPKLQRLYLHELPSISDAGLAHLKNLSALELLDIWEIPQMTDATLDVIAGLPNLKTLSIRSTGITDAAIDKILSLKGLTSLTLKDNGSVSKDALKKLTARKWTKLDIGAAPDTESAE